MKRLFAAAALVCCLPLAVRATSETFTFTDTSDTTLEHGTAYTWGLTSSTLSSLESALSGGQVITGVTLTLTNIADWTNQEDADVLYVNLLGGIATTPSSKVYDSADQGTLNNTTYGTDPFTSSMSGLSYTAAQSGSLIGGTGMVKYTTTPPSDGSSVTYESTGSNVWTDPTITYKGVSYQNPGTFSADDSSSDYTITYGLSASNIAVLTNLLTSTQPAGTTIGLGFGPDCDFTDTNIILSVTTAPRASVAETGSSLAALGLGLIALFGYGRCSRRARA